MELNWIKTNILHLTKTKPVWLRYAFNPFLFSEYFLLQLRYAVLCFVRVYILRFVDLWFLTICTWWLPRNKQTEGLDWHLWGPITKKGVKSWYLNNSITSKDYGNVRGKSLYCSDPKPSRLWNDTVGNLFSSFRVWHPCQFSR